MGELGVILYLSIPLHIFYIFPYIFQMLPYTWAFGTWKNSEPSRGGVANSGLFIHISYLFLFIFPISLHIF